jgi:hypothetical protein
MMHACRSTLGIAVLGLLLAFTRAHATTVIQPTFEKLVGSSDYIVRAVVKSVDSEWRENPEQPGRRYIASKVTLDVREVIKGTPPNPLVLDLVGGRIGDQELVVDGAPKFQAGQENILFSRSATTRAPAATRSCVTTDACSTTPANSTRHPSLSRRSAAPRTAR